MGKGEWNTLAQDFLDGPSFCLGGIFTWGKLLERCRRNSQLKLLINLKLKDKF